MRSRSSTTCEKSMTVSARSRDSRAGLDLRAHRGARGARHEVRVEIARQASVAARELTSMWFIIVRSPGDRLWNDDLNLSARKRGEPFGERHVIVPARHDRDPRRAAANRSTCRSTDRRNSERRPAPVRDPGHESGSRRGSRPPRAPRRRPIAIARRTRPGVTLERLPKAEARVAHGDHDDATVRGACVHL